MPFRVGIDTGGTFTDLVALDEETGEVRLAKVLSTPASPAQALLNALAQASIPLAHIRHLIHGTTVATNALLERKGARVAYVTTEGFEDVPFIQRIRREYHYDLMWNKPEPLTERYHCFGVRERVDYRGNVITPLDLDSLAAVLERGQVGAIEAVAVCYLFAYLNPAHEEATLRHLQQALPQLPISLSSHIAPIWREYERASTTIADAYLRPLLTRYIADLNEQLHTHGLVSEWSLMKSNGGMMPSSGVAENAVQTIMSGPAGGMIACNYFAELTGHREVVTLDMGGTSCDVGLLVEGVQRYTTEFEIEWGIPINVPLIDIKSIGAGGGSIAWLDAGGLLHVGPESAGANPGPICYNQGGKLPTVTDANAVLGRVAPERFLERYEPAVHDQATAALEALGQPLNLSVIDTALAIVDIANANMIDAIKLMTLERGLDPRRFALLAFGGAGPLHAAGIARGLGIPRVLIPPYPGMCSALGMLVADLRADKVMTYPASSDRVTAQDVLHRFESLLAAAGEELRREGFGDRPTAATTVSMRYLGQNYEEDIPVSVDELRADTLAPMFERFHRHHEERYGYAIRDEIIEIVALKVTLLGAVAKPKIAMATTTEVAQPYEKRQTYFRDLGWMDCPVYRRTEIPLGAQLSGPAIVEEHGSTTLVEPGQSLAVDGHGMLVITNDKMTG
jgi:N-methylhydantoinase A